MTAAEIEKSTLERIRKLVKEELSLPASMQTTKRISATLREIAFQAEVAAQEIERTAS